jgi:hypothetical protein
MRAQFAVRLVLAACVLSACGADVFAQSVSLNPVADAFVTSAEPSGNYGGAGAFGVSGPGLPNGELQALLRFDLASAKSSFDAALGPGNWLLSSATLQLAAASQNNPIFNTSGAGQFSATWLENDSWNEGSGSPSSPGISGVTWNSLPSFLSPGDQSLGTFSFDGSTTAMATYSLTVSSGLAGDTAAGGPASILLSAAAGETTLSGVFNSRSFGTANRRPLLTLTAVAVPEPATWVLAAGAAAALCCRARVPRR